MKRFILIAAALVAAASSAKADETSESILRHIAETFASYGNYEVRFTVSAQGMGNMSGNYFVSGDRYRIKAPETGAVQRRHQPLRNLCGRQGGGHRRSRHRFAQHPEQPHARLRVRPGRVRKYLYGAGRASNARQWKRSNSFRAATVTATER